MSGALLDEVLAKFKALPPDRQAELRKIAEKDVQQRPWVPMPGPQRAAYESTADVLLFGGSAGPGKTDLCLGLAFTAHKNSLILRRQYTDLSAMIERAVQINRSRKGLNASIPPKIRTADGRFIEFGACHNLGDEQAWKGRPHDLILLDEAVDFTESQVRFLIAWNRSVDEKQRCRVVLASNPPVTVEGEWLVKYFAPWLDETHPNPAKPGELRWFIPDPDDDKLDIEVPGPEPVTSGGKAVKPLSRTFIPSTLADNPFLARTDYAAKLDSLPEPYRSAYRDGNFMLGRKDDEHQLIPTDWIRAAQSRWTPHPPRAVPMCAIGVDCAQGGCFDDITEILTNQGWKKFSALSGLEQVLSLQDDTAVWAPITALHCYEHIGPMNVFDGTRVNFAITDNHNLLVRTRPKSRKYKIARYDSLAKEFCIRRGNTWGGTSEKNIRFETIRALPNGGNRKYLHEFKMLDWAEFLGWFVSEGCVTKSKRDRISDRISIAQNAGPKMEQIKSLLGRMGLRFHERKNGQEVSFISGAIGRHLGAECGHLARNKRIPPYIREGSCEVIDAFLRSFALGDGTRGSRGQTTYITSSMGLANDLQEVLCKVGRAGKLINKNYAGSTFRIGNREVTRKFDTFAVYERRSRSLRTGWNRDSDILKKNVARVQYSGFVYCVSTPLRTIMVRRNGCPMWSGNSDFTVLSCRHDNWFAPLIAVPGVRTKTGADIAGLVVTHRKDACQIIIDMGGGYGGPAFEAMEQNGLPVVAYKGSSGTADRTRDRQLGFSNVRTASYWAIREMLDPSQPGGATAALPPDPELVSDLTAVTFKITSRGIQAETKEDVVKKLKRSPDKGDALVIAWTQGPKASTHASNWLEQGIGGQQGRTPKVVMGHQNTRR